MKTIKLSRTTTPRPWCLSNIILTGKVSSSQDGVVVSPYGIAPTHSAGHGNCSNILIEYT